MGLLGLARDIALLPVRLAPPLAGLAIDATRHAAGRVGRIAASATVDASHSSAPDLAHHHRRHWVGDGRIHLELRTVEAHRQVPYLQTVLGRLGSLEGVSSAIPISGIGRVVVHFDPDVIDIDRIIAVLEDAEAESGVSERPFGRERPDHPADIEPVDAALLLIGTDIASAGIASVARAMRVPTAPIPLDVAGLLTVVSYVPWLREYVDQHIHSPAGGVGLAVARAVTGGLSQQLGGPAADIVHRASQVAAATTRRGAWERLEPELSTAHPAPELDGLLIAEPRPGQLPQGPIERMATPTSVAAFAGAGVGLVLNPDIDKALQFLVAGSPKAARWGREAHSAHLATMLAGRDVLVMDMTALDRLDRLDIIVVDGSLLMADSGRGAEPGPYAGEFLAQARTAGLDIWVATDHPERYGRLSIAGTIGTGAQTVESIRAMQRDDHGVGVVMAGEHPALAVGDASLGIRRPDRPVPWTASIIGSDSLIDGYVLALAIESAKRNAHQAAGLAIAGTGVAGLMALGGLHPGGLKRVMGAVNLSALIAHANGTRLAVATARRPLPGGPTRAIHHSLPASAVMAELGTTDMGLRSEEAEARKPVIPTPPGPVAEFVRATGAEMVNPLTPILAAGAGLAAAAGTAGDAAAVAGVMGFNALLGGAQRFRADRATRALLERSTKPVRVIRDGRPVDADVDDVVVGDIIHLQAGDVVPADGRILSATALEVDESSLTGESMPVAKFVDSVDVDTPVSDRTSMVYAGTMLVSGSVEAVVVAIGTHTESFRGISLAIGTPPETGVEQRLEDLTAKVTPVSVTAGLAMVGSGLARGLEASQVLGSGVGLAVAAVPEGLPLIATAAQQAAARRLSSHGVVVRNARAIEALGRVDVVCADKTGTLTVGRIRVETVVGPAGEESPPADLGDGGRRVLAMARAATPEPEHDRRLAHPTDRAILYAVDDAELDWADLLDGWEPTESLPFEPSRGYHVGMGEQAGEPVLAIKGAPEILLPKCVRIRREDGSIDALSKRRRAEVEATLDAAARRGLRILVVAERDAADVGELDDADVADLTYVGSIGLADPLRPTSHEAVEDLSASGIRVLMITGDHPVTAEGIAAELGLNTGETMLTGAEIDGIGDDELARRLATTDVCARVTPSHKVRIVRALRQAGHVVAMTGDGANDAPAIRLADVGIALGTRATDAARSASDLVIVDDSIETIVAAVVEGRALWKAVRDAISVLVGGNLGEVAFTLAGSVPSGIAPLNTRQLLLVNLMTDALPAMAIAVTRPPKKTPRELMAEGPDQALGKELDRAILLRAAATTVGASGGFVSARLTGRRKRASTVGLVSLVGTELGQTLVTSWRSPLVVASTAVSFAALFGAVQIPGVSRAFGCTPLGPIGWTQAMTSAFAATAGSVIVPAVMNLGSEATS